MLAGSVNREYCYLSKSSARELDLTAGTVGDFIVMVFYACRSLPFGSIHMIIAGVISLPFCSIP
jgi:hypothetical protein